MAMRVWGMALGILLGLAVPTAGQGPPPGMGSRGGYGPGPENRGPGGFSAKWWTNPQVIRRLGLTEDQQKRVDAVYQQSRLKLIDLTAALAKEEALMEPLLAAEHPQEAAVVAQIDRIANARAELEKANARMLLGFRLVLSAEQWKDLQERGGSMGPGPGRRMH